MFEKQKEIRIESLIAAIIAMRALCKLNSEEMVEDTLIEYYQDNYNKFKDIKLIWNGVGNTNLRPVQKYTAIRRKRHETGRALMNIRRIMRQTVQLLRHTDTAHEKIRPVEEILKLMKNMCEGHYTVAQNFLRTQAHLNCTVDVSILADAVMVMKALEMHLSKYYKYVSKDGDSANVFMFLA